MTIVASDLKLIKSENVSNTAANGGKMGTIEIVDGVKNNIFDDVSQSDRLAGATFYRKVFAKNANALNEVLINPVFHFKSFTPGQDRVEMFEGTQTDTQADITGSERMYGVATLNTDIAAGSPGASFDVLLEDPAQSVYEVGPNNTIWVGDGTNQEYHENVTATAPSGGIVTLTLDAADQFSNNYLAATPTMVASCIYGSITTINAHADPVTATSAIDGDYDDVTYPIQGDNEGCVYGTLTLTFDSGTTFTADLDGTALASGGNISSDYIALHPVTGLPLCTISSAGWTGSWSTGDTLTIPLQPSAMPVWLKQIVPAGTNSFSGDNFSMRFGGESA